jgi:hypothetical protein
MTNVSTDKKKQMQDYVLMQAKEIESLKQEIAALSFKVPSISSTSM